MRAPFYSHMRYDIVPDAHVTVRRPDVVIVEGLNVLQPPPTPNDVAVSDLFDFSIYVDADDRAHHAVVRRPLPRAAPGRVQQPELVLQRLRRTSPTKRPSRWRSGFWNDINLPNLEENVLPTKHRATLVLREGRRPHRRAGAAAQALSAVAGSTRFAQHRVDRAVGVTV